MAPMTQMLSPARVVWKKTWVVIRTLWTMAWPPRVQLPSVSLRKMLMTTRLPPEREGRQR